MAPVLAFYPVQEAVADVDVENADAPADEDHSGEQDGAEGDEPEAAEQQHEEEEKEAVEAEPTEQVRPNITCSLSLHIIARYCSVVYQ